MMDRTALITFSIALLAGAASPGPAIMAVVAHVVGGEGRSAWPCAAGIILGDVFWLTAAVMGLSTLATSSELTLQAIKYVGACYLLYVAYRLWNAKSERWLAESSKQSNTRLNSFLAGLALEMSNPKTMAFYLAVMPTLIEVNDMSIGSYATILLSASFIYIAVFTAYIFLAHRSRQFVRTHDRQNLVRRTSAAVLAATALTVASR